MDIHWALTAIKTPSESYNRVLSCIIDHANPHNGLCYPSQSIIAIETGYSVETVKRAVNWWKKQGFLKTESRGLGHALACHPQWKLLESFWVGVTSDIEEQKASRVTKGTYDVGHQGDLREGHHADLQNLKLEPQTLTPKNEPHPERVISPSVKVTTPLEGQLIRGKEEGIQRGEVESAPTDSQRPAGPSYGEACSTVSGYCQAFHWDHLTPEDFEAAVVAELRESGAGRAVVRGLAMQRAKEKGTANE